MASPAGQFRPWRLITAYLILTAVLYALVFFTEGSNSPKLGIDLQGGTQITLTAETLDGKAPSSSSMKQAQQIMTSRVNGSGVVGAQVTIDGSNHLIVTVPGNDELTGLTAPARLNIRPQLATGYDYTLVSAASTAKVTASGTAASGAPKASGAPSTSTSVGASAGSTAAVSPAPKATAEPEKTTGSTAPLGLRANAAATTPAPSAVQVKAAAPTTSATPTKAAASARCLGSRGLGSRVVGRGGQFGPDPEAGRVAVARQRQAESEPAGGDDSGDVGRLGHAQPRQR